jgi:hypothetical protein
LESARSSFLKTIYKLAPSHQSQQFKDGVLWHDCLTLASTDEVVLVTADKAFYQDQLYAKGLANSLASEAQDLPFKIRLLPAVAELLSSVKAAVQIDLDTLQAAFISKHSGTVYGTIERQGFKLQQRVDFSYRVFATENPAALFLEFTIDLSCSDSTDAGRADALLRLKGDCSYIPVTSKFDNVRNFGEHLTFTESDGTKREIRNAVIHIDSLIFGHKEVQSTVRYQLPDIEP